MVDVKQKGGKGRDAGKHVATSPKFKKPAKKQFKAKTRKGIVGPTQTPKPIAGKPAVASPKFEKKFQGKGAAGKADHHKQYKPKAGGDGTNKSNPLKRKAEEESEDAEKKKPKQVKKEKKTERKIKNNEDLFELKKRLKLLFEKFRRSDCQKTEKAKLCAEVTTLLKGRMKEIIFAHDSVRIVESLLKLSDRALWDGLYEEVKNDLVPMMKEKYAKFFVLKLLKYGTKEHRISVINAIMNSRLVDLASHVESSAVVEVVYNEYANAYQRKRMSMAFYGALYTICKDTEVKSLKDILESDPTQKDGILSQLKETITKLAEKPAFCNSIVHRVVLEYLTYCAPKDRTEMIETIRESIIKILHTKDGAGIGMHCIWHGTAKDRKVIIQSFKSHLSKICQEEHGSRILYAVFDHVDDTKLVGKVVVEEMLKTISTWAFTPVGRKVLLYFLAPRNPKHFHPDLQVVYVQGDGNAASKKDKDIRHQEFMTSASPALLRFASDNSTTLMKEPSFCYIMKEILVNCLGDKSEVYQDIAKLAFEPVDMPDMENPHFIEQVSVRAIFKSLFELDKSNFSENEEHSLFCDALLRCVPEESLQSWIHCNRGCFVLLMMLETEIPRVVKKVKELLQPMKKMIGNKKFVGAGLLLTALAK